jgi:hypothetical protein
MERIKPAEPVHFINRESRQRGMGKRRSRFQVLLEIEMEKIKNGKKNNGGSCVKRDSESRH